MDTLPDGDRELIESRYQDDQMLKQMAEGLARSEQSVSRSLSRIRKQLYACIRRKLTRGGKP